MCPATPVLVISRYSQVDNQEYPSHSVGEAVKSPEKTEIPSRCQRQCTQTSVEGSGAVATAMTAVHILCAYLPVVPLEEGASVIVFSAALFRKAERP